VASFHHAVKQALFACLGPASLTRMVDAGDGSWQEMVWRGARMGDAGAAAAGWERLVRAGDDFKGIPVRVLAPSTSPLPLDGAASASAADQAVGITMHQLVLPPAAPLCALVAALESRSLLRRAGGDDGTTVLQLGVCTIRCARGAAGGEAAGGEATWHCTMHVFLDSGAAIDAPPSSPTPPGVDVTDLPLLEVHRCLAFPDGFVYLSSPAAGTG